MPNVGFILLGLWLILFGLSALIPQMGPMGIFIAVLAIVAGILIIVGR